jgi:hypothetical protein
VFLSSYGTYGWDTRIPALALTPFDRSWNHDHESQYEAENGGAFASGHLQKGHYQQYHW